MVELRFDKWIEVMAYLDGRQTFSYKEISLACDLFYSHTHEIVSALKKKRFVNTNKRGRTVYVTLTKRGRRLAWDCKLIKQHFTEATK